MIVVYGAYTKLTFLIWEIKLYKLVSFTFDNFNFIGILFNYLGTINRK